MLVDKNNYMHCIFIIINEFTFLFTVDLVLGQKVPIDRWPKIKSVVLSTTVFFLKKFFFKKTEFWFIYKFKNIQIKWKIINLICLLIQMI